MNRIIFAATVLAMLTLTPAASAQNASQALSQLFDDERAFTWREDPLSATSDGVHDFDNRLPSVTAADFARQSQENQAFLTRLNAIDRAQLSHQEQVSYDLFSFMVGQRVTLARYNEWRMPMNSDSGFYSEILLLNETNSPRMVHDYENYIARLNDVPRYFREQTENMRQGVREGFTLPSAIIGGVSEMIAGWHFDRVEDTDWWRPFANFPETVPTSERERLAAAGRAAITTSVIPAYRDFQTFFANEYAPHARRTLGARDLPNGRAYYADLVRYFTTLPDATPQQIHRIGLSEVRRIRAEMEAIVREVGFEGSFSEFLTYLRTDPQFYPRTPEELLYHAAWITREIDGQLPDYFGHLPRTPYTVEPVPAAFAPNYTAGRCTPNSSATRWACTTTPTTASASSPTRCGAPFGWSSTPGCTRWNGIAIARSSTSWTTRPRPRTTSSTRSTATSRRRGRRSRTRWAS
jgi:uncharacterized protein (DUF885 family)